MTREPHDNPDDIVVVIAGDDLHVDTRPLRERALEAHTHDQAEFIASTAIQLAAYNQRRVEKLKEQIELTLGEIANVADERLPAAEVDGLIFSLTAYDDTLMLLRAACGCQINNHVQDLAHLGRLLASHQLICRVEVA